MKLSQLLSQREALVRQARLANLAFAHETLANFLARAQRAGLRGRLHAKSADPASERFGPTLHALDASQSVVEEHFTDEDLSDLVDVLAFLTGGLPLELTFEATRIADDFLAPLRAELAREGVAFDGRSTAIEEPSSPG